MGYRPSIRCPQLGFDCSVELGKFYGYIKLINSKSIKWLCDHGKLDNSSMPECEFLGGYGPTIIFTSEEFKEFIKLYEEDINEHDFSKDGVSYNKPYSIEKCWNTIADLHPEWCITTYEELINSTYDKIIEWG